MAITAKTVKEIAHLARLQIDEKDIPEYTKNLSNILELVEQMNQVDTSEVEPLAHPMDMVLRTREDEVNEEDQRKQFQEHAPMTEAGLYLVPQVLEE